MSTTTASAAALCGEVAHAAVLCPSFYEARIVQNPTLVDRALAGLRNGIDSAC